MSKSLKRVTAALVAAGHPPNIVETELARTAQQAADAIGCELDQIVKSIIFRGEVSGKAVMFVTAGGNSVDPIKASAAAGEPLGKADATLIRAQTGFAIGGVSPIGHISPILSFFDARLHDFDLVWAAAGTPNHVFGIEPTILKNISTSQIIDFT